jgi:hypothetical protein
MLGQSFAPLGDPNDPEQSQRPDGNGVQEAIRTMSLRLPRVLGAGAPAPAELLTGLGGAALNNPLAALLTQLIGQLSGQQGGGAPTAPTPTTDGLKPKLHYQETDPTTLPPPAPPGRPRFPGGPQRPNTA